MGLGSLDKYTTYKSMTTNFRIPSPTRITVKKVAPTTTTKTTVKASSTSTGKSETVPTSLNIKETLVNSIPYVAGGVLIYIGLKSDNVYVRNSLIGGGVGAIGGKLIGEEAYMTNILIGSGVAAAGTVGYKYLNNELYKAKTQPVEIYNSAKKELKKRSDQIPLPF